MITALFTEDDRHKKLTLKRAPGYDDNDHLWIWVFGKTEVFLCSSISFDGERFAVKAEWSTGDFTWMDETDFSVHIVRRFLTKSEGLWGLLATYDSGRHLFEPLLRWMQKHADDLPKVTIPWGSFAWKVPGITTDDIPAWASRGFWTRDNDTALYKLKGPEEETIAFLDILSPGSCSPSSRVIHV